MKGKLPMQQKQILYLGMACAYLLTLLGLPKELTLVLLIASYLALAVAE